jgi:hypothetical protein
MNAFCCDPAGPSSDLHKRQFAARRKSVDGCARHAEFSHCDADTVNQWFIAHSLPPKTFTSCGFNYPLCRCFHSRPFDAQNLLQDVNDLNQIALVFHHGVDVLVRTRNLV